MPKKDYYSILNIEPGASLQAIKTAYRLLALKYHPDHNPDNPEAVKKFRLVREAYEFLTQPEQKKKYDQNYKKTAPTPPNRPRNTQGPVKTSGKNLRYNLFINLEDVLNGCERSIRYIRKSGKEQETVQLKVKVPRGAFHHQRLKLKDYGDINRTGTGDLFVIIHLQNHPVFLKDGLNLRVNVPITYLDAALGNTLEVPTLKGTRKVKLKACQFEGLDQTLHGLGLPDHKSQAKGSLKVHFFIEHPKKLSPAQKNALQKVLRTWPPGEMMQQYQSYLDRMKRS